MATDLRSRNQYFDADSIANYFVEYQRALSFALSTVNKDELKHAEHLLNRASRVFVAGNGGSAAISDHLNCDFTKGVHTPELSNAFDVRSLVSSTALVTALANDEGYEKVFIRQLEMDQANWMDVVVLISSSGNSKNIVEALDFCERKKIHVVGLSGFGGGALKERASAKLHVNFNNYGIVEDCHQILMHVIAQYSYAKTRTTS